MSRIADINRELTTLLLDIPEKHFSKHIFGEGAGQAEIVCRQYLLTFVAGVKLNRALLQVLDKKVTSLAYYLPPVWRKFIGKQEINIASLRSAILWNGFVALMLLYGIFKIFKIILRSISAVYKQKFKNLGQYVYFDSLTPGNLPQPCKDGQSHDIISWYVKWPGRNQDIKTICHSAVDNINREVEVNGIPVISIPAPLLPLTHFKSIAAFIAWGVTAVLIALMDILRGRWWHAFILNQAALAAQVHMQDAERLASDYMFHNSNWIYRPLWTYEAEKQGSRVIFYFYSTNCELIKLSDDYPPLPYGWQAMNWSHYLVWDEYQAGFVRRAVGSHADISIVGQIWFSTSNKTAMPETKGNSIAVFDITPVNSSFYSTLGLAQDYYIPDVCIPFLDDIRKASEDCDCNMVWKQKRKRNDTDPAYQSFADHLSTIANVIVVDPDISANRVIEECDIVISMPYTSTALIAREIGKTSYYYDPTGLVHKNDRAAHGIEIISGIKELRYLLRDKLSLSCASSMNDIESAVDL